MTPRDQISVLYEYFFSSKIYGDMYNGVPHIVLVVSELESFKYFEKPKSAIFTSKGTWVRSTFERNSILFASAFSSVSNL